MSVEVQTLPATSTMPSVTQPPTTSPPPATSSSSYPLRDRSTLVRPERDLPEPSAPPEGGGGRREKFLDQFLSSVAPFPAVLHGKLSRMRELDEACVVRMREMDDYSKQHIHNIRHKWKSAADNNKTTESNTTNPTTTSSTPLSSSDSSPSSPPTSDPSAVSSGPNAMSVKFGVAATYDIEAAESFLRTQRDELLRLTRAKQSLASECYEGVDGHIRRLDVSLRKYETKLRKGTFDVTAQPVDRRKGSETQWDSEGRAMAAEVAAEMKTELDRLEGTGGGRRVKGKADCGSGVEGGKGEGGGGLGEPTYCLCHKVSFGQMVACDNDDCEIEWFHFACVGLESKPRGKWLCPMCREGGKKKKSKKEK